MINTEVGNLLVKYATHIQHWAQAGDVGEADETALAKRARENAWRLTSQLLQVLEHAKDSDLQWMLCRMAAASNKSEREQTKLYRAAKAEDHGFMVQKRELDALLKEIIATEKRDPDGLKAEAKQAKAEKERTVWAAQDAADELVRRERKKADARTARQVAKGAAMPVKKAARRGAAASA